MKPTPLAVSTTCPRSCNAHNHMHMQLEYKCYMNVLEYSSIFTVGSYIYGRIQLTVPMHVLVVSVYMCSNNC